MKRHDSAASNAGPTRPTEGPAGEQVRPEHPVPAGTTVQVELVPGADAEELTDTEWSAFMGLGQGRDSRQ